MFELLKQLISEIKPPPIAWIILIAVVVVLLTLEITAISKLEQMKP